MTATMSMKSVAFLLILTVAAVAPRPAPAQIVNRGDLDITEEDKQRGFYIKGRNSGAIRGPLTEEFQAFRREVMTEVGMKTGFELLSEISSLAFSPDGKMLLCGLENGSVEVWSVPGPSRIERISSHDGPYVSVLWSRTGRLIVSAGQHKTLKFSPVTGYTISNGQRQELPARKTVRAAAYRSEVHIRDMETGEIQRLPQEIAGNLVAFPPDETMLCIAHQRRKAVTIWDLAGREILRTIDPDGGWNTESVAFSPDNHTVAVGGSSYAPDAKKGDILLRRLGEVRIYDVRTGELRRTLVGPPREKADEIGQVTFSPYGSRVIASCNIREIADDPNFEKAKVLRTFIPEIADGPNFKAKVLRTLGGEIMVWDAKTGALLKTLAAHSATINVLAVSPDGSWIASGSDDQTIRLWDLAGAGAKPVKVLTGWDDCPAGGIRRTMHTKFRGRVPAYAIKQVLGGAATAVPQGERPFQQTEDVMALAFSPDSTKLASGGSNGTIKLWPLVEE